MALFKILKGTSTNLGASGSTNSSVTHEGWAYFTTDTKKLYIDITSNETPVINSNRLELNANSSDNLCTNRMSIVNGSNFRLPGYSLFAIDHEGKAQGISLYSTGYTGVTANTNYDRIHNITSPMDFHKGLFYNNSATNYDVNETISDNILSSASHIDLRYTDNCTIAAGKHNLSQYRTEPIFLLGYVGWENDYFYLARRQMTNAGRRSWIAYSEIDFTTNNSYASKLSYQGNDCRSGYVYWFIGYACNDGTFINLFTNNPLYIVNENHTGLTSIDNLVNFDKSILRSAQTSTFYMPDGTTVPYRQNQAILKRYKEFTLIHTNWDAQTVTWTEDPSLPSGQTTCSLQLRFQDLNAVDIFTLKTSEKINTYHVKTEMTVTNPHYDANGTTANTTSLALKVEERTGTSSYSAGGITITMINGVVSYSVTNASAFRSALSLETVFAAASHTHAYATTAATGMVKLVDSYTSTSNSLVATANNVATAAKMTSSANTTAKIFLLGTTSQTGSAITSYSNQYVYTTANTFSAGTIGINNNSTTDKIILQYNSTDQSLNFIFP